MGAMSDFAFLRGRLAVAHRWRTATGAWAEAAGRTEAWSLLGGRVVVSEVQSAGGLHGVSLKVHDVATGLWSIWWVDATTGRLGPPVHGRWQDDTGRFAGAEADGTLVAYAITTSPDGGAEWEQSRSVDGGRAWTAERTMSMASSSAEAAEPGPAGEFGFLARPLSVAHRRRSRVGEGWEEFTSAHHGRSLLGGSVSVDEVGLHPAPAAGLTFRTRDAASGKWSIWWVDSTRGGLEPPVHGGFAGDTGTFVGAEGGRLVRFTWADVGTPSPAWTQDLSSDGGVTWERDWEMAFSTPAGGA